MSTHKKRVITLWIVVPGMGLALAYLGLTLAAWIFVRHVRQVEAVSYADMALPTRWARYQTIRGNHHIASGLKLLEQGKLSSGFQQLRVGVARAPRNRDGRLALAALYAQTGRTDLAQTVLTDGLAYHRNDTTYVATLLEFLSGQTLDKKVLAIGRQLMADPSLSPAVHELAAFRSALAATQMGDYDEAERLLGQNHLHGTPSGRLLLAQIEWERGYQELALALLRNLADELPRDEAVYARLASYLAETGRDDELRRRAIVNQLTHPGSVRSYLDQFNALAHAGDLAAREKAIDQAFATFQNSPPALLALADFAATEGETSLAERVAAQFTANSWANARATRLMAIEARLVAGKHAAALTGCQELLAEPNLEPHYRQIATGLQAIALYGTGDPVAGHANLASLMTQAGLRADSLFGIARRLLAMGHTAPAREVLAHAVKLDPKNQAVLTRLIELDMDNRNTPAIAANLRTLTGMRRPSPLVLKRAQTLLGSDTCLFLPGRSELLALVQNALPR